VFVLVVVAAITLHVTWLPRAVLATGVATLIALAVLNPDRFIAEQNVERFNKTDRIDVWYLRDLSADAVPALDKLPAPYRDCALFAMHQRLGTRPDDWRQFNLGREQARDLLRADPPAGGNSCNNVRTTG
jgi:hypothetical protein